ncbi:MAG TPA: MCP four helix bundle domain-containing protein [Pseudobacteroides sp.]|nr:MCP four helix bundle domain-containing protein [Pseudobacteroides sp.]
MFKWFGNLKIGVRIIIGFFIITVISCIIGVVGIYNLKNVQDSYANEYTNSAKALELVERISSHFQQSRVNIFGYALSPDSEEEKAYYTERIAQHESDVDKYINSYY